MSPLLSLNFCLGTVGLLSDAAATTLRQGARQLPLWVGARSLSNGCETGGGQA